MRSFRFTDIKALHTSIMAKGIVWIAQLKFPKIEATTLNDTVFAFMQSLFTHIPDLSFPGAKKTYQSN
jgi:hypothetical protein